MIAETFLEKTIRDQSVEASVSRTTIRVLHHGGPENLGIRGSDVRKGMGKREQARLTSRSAAIPPLP